jgi:hypothetical protein
MIFTRTFNMPNLKTFSIPAIKKLLGRYIKVGDIVIDPFARGSSWGTITNDLNPHAPTMYHLDAPEFLDKLIDDKVQADVFLYDPPYSPRQISECYKIAGLKATSETTQSARLYREVKDRCRKLLRPEGIAIACGWNSLGMGKEYYEMIELLLVNHGGAHNDTIVTVEKLIKK